MNFHVWNFNFISIKSCKVLNQGTIKGSWIFPNNVDASCSRAKHIQPTLGTLHRVMIVCSLLKMECLQPRHRHHKQQQVKCNLFIHFQKSELASIFWHVFFDCSGWCQLKGFYFSSDFQVLRIKVLKLEMSEGDFWNNLDSFVEKQNSENELEKVGDWLKNVPDPNNEKTPPKATAKPESPTRWALKLIQLLVKKSATTLVTNFPFASTS